MSAHDDDVVAAALGDDLTHADATTGGKDTLRDALYRAAAAGAEVRAQYARLKDDQAARFFVYVLLLPHGKLYVGSTDNPYARFLDHFTCSASSAKWVREWGPPERIVEMARNCRADDEEYKYMQYASMFGWEHVRGGHCCRVLEPRAPRELHGFRRDSARPFDYLTRAELDDVLARVRGLEKDLKARAPPAPPY